MKWPFGSSLVPTRAGSRLIRRYFIKRSITGDSHEQEKGPLFYKGTLFASNGSQGRIRTADKVVNSHPLYRLSYRGM